MTHLAKCACGSSSIEVSGEPTSHAVCHCDNCKKRTGSAFGISAYFRKQDVVRIEGQTTIYALHNAARNEDQERYFCSKCGTTLYWYVSSYPEYIGIAGGCFDTDALGQPKINASLSKKMPWLMLPDHWKASE